MWQVLTVGFPDLGVELCSGCMWRLISLGTPEKKISVLTTLTTSMASKEDLDVLRKQLEEMKTQLAAAPVPPEPIKVVFPPRDRKLKKFSGEGESYSDFIEEVEQVIDARPGITEAEKADLIWANLEGAARDEAKCLSSEDRKQPILLKKALESTFGEKLSLPQLMAKLYARKQEAGDTVQQYGRALLLLSHRIVAKGGSTDKIIQSVFADNVRDGSLRRELKGILRKKPEVPFADLREAAQNWEEDADGSRRSAGVREGEVCLVEGQQALGLHQIVQQQQKMMGEMAASLKVLQESLQSKGDARGQAWKPARRDGNGQLICYHCQKPGHIARSCPSIQCHRCKQNGHVVADCASKPAASREIEVSESGNASP